MGRFGAVLTQGDFYGADAAYANADPVLVGAPIAPSGQGFGIWAGSSGNVTVILTGQVGRLNPDGTQKTFTFPVVASGGYQVLPFAVYMVVSVDGVTGPDQKSLAGAFVNHY